MLATLDLLILRLSSKKFPDLRLFATIPQVLGIAAGQKRLAYRVEKDRVVGNRENTRKLVRDDYESYAQAFLQFKDKIVQSPGTNGIQSCGRFVEKKYLGIQGHGSGKSSPLSHATTKLCRHEVLEAGKTNQRKLEAGN